jgi:predicted PurR-regulated permease PerM
MLAIDIRAARVTWTVFLVLGVIGLVYLARGPILLFVFAMFLAYMVSPLVDLTLRFAPPRFPRALTLAVVYLLLMGAIGAALFAVGSRAVTEASNLAQRMPDLIQTHGDILDSPLPGWIEPWRPQLHEFVTNQLKSATEEIVPLLKSAGMGLLAGLGNLGFTLLVPILSFFFLKDAQELRQMLLEAVHDEIHRGLFDRILTDINILIGHYIRALVLLSIAAFFSSLLFFEFTGMQYAMLLAAVIALFEFIPVLGPLTAIVVSLAVGAFNGYPHLLAMFAFFVCYRLFQDYALLPYLMGAGVELHPLIVLFGVLAGEQIAGVAGMFLSIPVMATLRIVWINASRKR